MDKYDAELFYDIYREISMLVGIDTAIEMYNMYKGQQISFPVHLYDAECVKKVIANEYDGTNLRDLARKYDYSEKTLRRMIKQKQAD
ncbi:MAG: hypothetical protein IJN48_02370 [Clostridia bacterium]|nr:hypothetical protein [Clostridia bacterium]